MRRVIRLTSITLISLICIVFTVFSCQKEEVVEPSKPDGYWGQGEALMNGNSWSVDAYATININHGNGFELFMDSLVSNFLIAQGLSISKIPYVPGTYPVVDTRPSTDDGKVGGFFCYTEHDAILSCYDILESDSSSFVTLESYDASTHEVKGTFDLTFYHETTQVGYPDTIRFRNGVFHTRILEE